MSEKFLHRKDSPFGDEIWDRIDETVVNAARGQLSGRRILHVDGPYGLGFKTVGSGDFELEEKHVEGTSVKGNCPGPVVMIESSFGLSARDIAAFEQSGAPLELAEAARAAMACARQEDELIFNGSKTLNLDGVLTSERSQSFNLRGWEEVGTAAEDIINAATILDGAGFGGPYILALRPGLYNLLFRRYPQGNATELEHIGQITTGGIVKSAAIPTGGILLNAGREFASIVVGQDLMTAFVGPADGEYEFNVAETVALRLTTPEAICILKQ